MPTSKTLSAITVAICLMASHSLHSQSAAEKRQLAGTQSIGDLVQSTQRAAPIPLPPPPLPPGIAASPQAVTAPAPQRVHLLYMHGISAEGAGDSILLRAAICKYLHECTQTKTARIYVDSGPFAGSAEPPDLEYMQTRIWKTKDEWSASAPFIDRYEISGNNQTPIVLDEINWWPLAYPLKCKFLIRSDATLTGPSTKQLSLCSPSQGNQPDPTHPGRFLSYRWITTSEASDLAHIQRHAAIINRTLKNGLMDWGFGDAVMALGPMQDILTSAIRQLLKQSLEGDGIDLATARPEDPGPQFSFITHSLGSYLSLAALNSDLLGPPQGELADFKITPTQRKAVDYYSAHTSGFYFLANQVELLELARVSIPAPSTTGKTATHSIAHWQEMRNAYLQRRAPNAPGPQIIAWSDPSDLLSWDVPDIANVHVVNLHVHNSAFKIPPFITGPTGAHDNYAKNQTVFRTIFKPTQSP